MECDEVLREVEHYIHGELDRERAAQLADHLSACGPCLDRAEFQRRLRDIVREKCRSIPPERLVVRVQQAIRVEGDLGPGSASA
jgi:anti-sigma factor (TIGR02949 family)